MSRKDVRLGCQINKAVKYGSPVKLSEKAVQLSCQGEIYEYRKASIPGKSSSCLTVFLAKNFSRFFMCFDQLYDSEDIAQNQFLFILNII